MSSGVSQIEYWLGTNRKAGTNNQNSNGKDGKEGGDEAVYLSYDVFMALAVIGGFFALDHLYLRSPLTFLAKIVINLLFFGVWWLWDALQAVFNDDVIKVFGLGVPSMGPKGIAAGVLANDVPDKKHMRFFIYAIALMFTGIFGVDSFLLGDKTSGFIRLISLITMIFSPIALGWWLYKLFKFFFDTKSVTNGNYEYFGAPSPPLPLTIVEKLTSSIPILGSIIKPLVGAVENVGEFAEGVVTNPSAAIDSVLRGPVQKIASLAKPVIEPVIQPVTNTVQMGLKTVQTGLETAQQSVALGKHTLDTGASLAQSTIKTVGDVATAASAALSVAPAIASLSSGLTPNTISAAKTALTTQKGGGSASNVLPFVLMGTLAIIAVSGFILTYRRSRQNERPRKDDSPPEPGVLRESDKKESS